MMKIEAQDNSHLGQCQDSDTEEQDQPDPHLIYQDPCQDNHHHIRQRVDTEHPVVLFVAQT